MIKKYKKKPVVIESLYFDIDDITFKEVRDFVGDSFEMEGASYPRFFIKTLEGKMEFTFGDYIIKGVKGEFYPCRKDIFEETYEEVDDQSN